MRLIYRPLGAWVGPETRSRKPGPFFSSWMDTVKLLDREIDMLVSGNRNHAEVVLQVDVDESAMRLDGGIRADAKVKHPGVVISFQGPNGPLRFACDKFEKAGKATPQGWMTIPAWQMNVRAIALGLEALRKVERYGIAESDQQYQGFTAIGSGIATKPEVMTREQAAVIFKRIWDRHVETYEGWAIRELLLTDRDERVRLYRKLVKRVHPDSGGDKTEFQELQQVWEVLNG